MTTSGNDEKSNKLPTQNTDHIMTTLTLTYGWLRRGTGLTWNEATDIYYSVVPVGIGQKVPKMPELELKGCAKCTNMDRHVTMPTWYKGLCAVPWNIAVDDCSRMERSNTRGGGTRNGQWDTVWAENRNGCEGSASGKYSGETLQKVRSTRSCTRQRHMRQRHSPGGHDVAKKEIWEDPMYVGCALTSKGRRNRKILRIEKETVLLRSGISTG